MKIFFDRLQMIQFAKLTGLNRYLSTFLKISLLQGCRGPVLDIFREKNDSMTIQNSADGRWCKGVQFWWKGNTLNSACSHCGHHGYVM